MKKSIAAAALGATLLAGSAFAAQDGPPPGPRDPLARADTNQDGIVTRDEMLADVAQRFARVDANHDGKITMEERQAFAEARRAEMEARRGPGGPGGGGFGGRGMGRMDANGDGSVTLDEERARAGERFDRADTNHDGKLDQAERDAARARMMSRRGPPSGDGPPPPPPADAPTAPGGN